MFSCMSLRVKNLIYEKKNHMKALLIMAHVCWCHRQVKKVLESQVMAFLNSPTTVTVTAGLLVLIAL